MKKVIVFLMCVFAVTSAMSAEPTCNGGTPVKSNTTATNPDCSADTCNGHEFCKSDKTMNWWSAFAWCESQNRKLAEFKTMCPGVSQAPANTAGDCPNLQGVENFCAWSSLASTSGLAFAVCLSSGAVGHDGRHRDYYYALCE